MFVVCPKCGAKYQIPVQVNLKSGQKMQCSACEHYFVYTPQTMTEKPTYSVRHTEGVIHEDIDAPVIRSIPTSAPKTEFVLPEVFQPSFVPKKKNSLILPILIVIFSFLILLVLIGLAWQYRMELRDQDFLKNLQVARPAVEKSLTITDASRSIITPTDSIVMPPKVLPDSVSVTQDIPETTEQKLSPETRGDDLFAFRSVRFKVVPNQDTQEVQIEGFVYNDSDQVVVLPPTLKVTAYDFQGSSVFTKEIYLPQQTLHPNQEIPFFATYSPAPEEIKWIDISS